jgi:hypothetical protein
MNSKYLIAAALGAAAFLTSRKSSAASFDYDGVPATERYPPHSPEAKLLFRKAAAIAGLPESWANEPGTHNIMAKESGGWVGRPNYKFNLLFGKNFNDPGRRGEWGKAHQIIRLDESSSQGKKRHPGFNSRASGLGQMQPGSIKKMYPDGFKGVGDPLNEAVGYLRYIASRYGSPHVAYSVYGKGGPGSQKVYYTHAMTGKKRSKGFKEGY